MMILQHTLHFLLFFPRQFWTQFSRTLSRPLSRQVSRLFLAACGAAMLSACGGGGSDSNYSSNYTPATLQTTDTTVGTGAVAASGNTVTITYTAWLYDATATNYKGTQIDSQSLSFVVGKGQVISGLDQGIVGMKVGGTRTLLIPYSLAYGSSAYGAVPAYSGLVFSVTLTAVQ